MFSSFRAPEIRSCYAYTFSHQGDFFHFFGANATVGSKSRSRGDDLQGPQFNLQNLRDDPIPFFPGNILDSKINILNDAWKMTLFPSEFLLPS